jgi:hypothetical protein
MKLEAKIFKGKKILMEDEAIFSGQGKFQQQLEQCLITLCKNMSISVPIWVGKNTREFVRFKWTSFNEDQFFDKVFFDRFEIRLIE